MKNIILLLILASLVQWVSCNDAILSKFLQHGYKLKDVRIQLMRYDKNFYSIFEIKAFKYNRTTTAHNTTLKIKIDAQDKVEVITQAYKFMSNEYRHFPIRFQLNFKKAFDSNAAGLQSIKNCGNITTFYFLKDTTYHSCNFVIDETRFPPLIPDGLYLIEQTLLYLNKEIAVMNLYGEVYTPMDYPKKLLQIERFT